jgi:hypothetical protein
VPTVDWTKYWEVGVRVAHRQADLGLAHEFFRLVDIPDPPVFMMEVIFTIIRLFHCCKYPLDDIVTVLVHGAVYGKALISSFRRSLGYLPMEEIAMEFGALLYLAHGYVLDESCKIKHWHKYVFANYCTPQALESVIYVLFRSRGFLLSVHPKLVEPMRQQFYETIAVAEKLSLPSPASSCTRARESWAESTTASQSKVGTDKVKSLAQDNEACSDATTATP